LELPIYFARFLQTLIGVTPTTHDGNPLADDEFCFTLTRALLGQYLHGRIGLLNYPLYDLALRGQAYGPGAPLHAIAYGDNWFYYGSNGYNLGVGLGTLDVANFANFLSSQF
jgi:hypothetical protein